MNFKNLFTAIINRLLFWLPDKYYLCLLYRVMMNKPLNLKSPKTFNEKLNWLKLYCRRPEFTQMVDKYAVKEYVGKIIGQKYIIPTIGVWNTPNEIDFSQLPDSFVLKTTHGGGNTGVVICRDKNAIDLNEVYQKLNKSYSSDIYTYLREWPYKDVKKRIIAEPLMVDSRSSELIDYKFFAFNGRVEALFIATDRSSGDVKFDFYDNKFNHLDIVQSHPMSGKIIEKPETFNEMISIAEKLSSGIPHVRVDLYQVNGKVYFGELTFFHHGGVVPFIPEKWDEIFGSWISLPSPQNN